MRDLKTLLVTGGAGFIGSTFVTRQLQRGRRVINLDALTYAGHLENLGPVRGNPRHVFVHGRVEDSELLEALFRRWQPEAVVHFAAETHVDRSIVGSEDFVQTNVIGTHRLVEAATAHHTRLAPTEASRFRFLAVSTDEVFGSLGPEDPPFDEASPIAPNSPYAASKAAADMFVRAAFRTHGLPTLTTHCTNNFGPRQHPEKLIPLMVQRALARQPLPVYGDGEQRRDWIHVDDHCAALERILEGGEPGDTFVIGADCERSNLEIVEAICAHLDQLAVDGGPPRASLIRSVPDRPGHDRRYAVDASALRTRMGWRPEWSLDTALASAVAWYLQNSAWLRAVSGPEHRRWLSAQYGRSD